MNAMTSSAGAGSPVAKFKILLKREFWENRGGFLWAPIIAGGVALFFALLGVIGGSVGYQRSGHGGVFRIDDVEMKGDALAAHLREVAAASGDVVFMVGIGLALAIMMFVIFFYALGSLYDERRDRSILFWKSMPVSDHMTVLSKLSWALLLAPALSVGLGLLIGAALLLLVTLGLALNGLPGASAALLDSHPFHIVFNVLSALPVYIAWALPTIGWLMLCSAWARRLPFLWAVLLPILGCMMISLMMGIANMISGIEFAHDTMWYAIVARGLGSLLPGSWYFNPHVQANYAAGVNDNLQSPQDLIQLIDFSSSWSAFATADLWIGVILGAAMIYAAIRLRRWRDEG